VQRTVSPQRKLGSLVDWPIRAPHLHTIGGADAGRAPSDSVCFRSVARSGTPSPRSRSRTRLSPCPATDITWQRVRTATASAAAAESAGSGDPSASKRQKRSRWVGKS